MNQQKRLDLIVDAVNLAQKAKRLGIPRSCYAKVLRESVHFFWERRHGSKDQCANLRSEAAAELRCGKDRLRYDHAIPVRDMVTALLALSPVGPANVDAVLKRHSMVALITKDEDELLRKSGLKNTMPKGADPLDPAARYTAVGIKTVPNQWHPEHIATQGLKRTGRERESFVFRGVDGANVAPEEWLRLWAARFPNARYDPASYAKWIGHSGALTFDDIVGIGRWKDAAKRETKWKPNTASVAYEVWMQAAAGLSVCPSDDNLDAFLADWSERMYTDTFSAKTVVKRFGLSRASTLLHFLSKGRFPIFDSRVRRALGRLTGKAIPPTIRAYLDDYCPLFVEIAAECGSGDLRQVDQALFSFGAKRLPFGSEASSDL